MAADAGIAVTGYEWRRKLIHAATGVAAPWVLVIQEPWASLALGAVAASALVVETARLRSPAFARRLERALPGIHRETERNRPSGALFLVLGYALTSALFPARPAAAGILALALGDAAASVAGRAWGPRRGREGRTAAGTAACFVVASGAVALVTGAHGSVALAAGAAAAALERWDPWGLDNVLVPLGAATVVWLAMG